MATKEEAKQYLCDAAPERCFWVNNGRVLKSMDELANALAQMNDDTFDYHANSDKNDFSSWINDVIGDKKLANDLLSSKNKEFMLKKLRARINTLKKKAA